MTKKRKNKQGVVYVMSNPSYKKEFLKVGYTTTTSEERANQLYTTGVPDKFKIEYEVKFKQARQAEKQIHLSLKKYRYNKSREFFTCGLREIKNAIDKADGKIETPIPKGWDTFSMVFIKFFLLLNIVLLLIVFYSVLN
ncbi:MAG: GIY-YIG nuclease family protein [Cocleimonas sp.]|nr:GIY-YIG nuclease family protein [Cocleimonas sp.]